MNIVTQDINNDGLTDIVIANKKGVFLFENLLDKNISAYDKKNNTALHSTYVAEERSSIFGNYQALDRIKLSQANKQEQSAVFEIQENAKKQALKTVALFPVGMFFCYSLLLLYFRSKGGYKIVLLNKAK